MGCMKLNLLKWAVAVATAATLGTLTSAVAEDASGAAPSPSPAAPQSCPPDKGPDAGGPGHGHRRGPRGEFGPGGLDRLGKKLGLSDTQKQQVHTIFEESKPVLQPLFEAVKKERDALRAAMQATPPDEAAIRAQSAKVSAAEADLAVQRATVSQKVQAVLTPDQAKKFKEMEASAGKPGGKFGRKNHKNQAGKADSGATQED